jgi:hypothetical protein
LALVLIIAINRVKSNVVFISFFFGEYTPKTNRAQWT